MFHSWAEIEANLPTRLSIAFKDLCVAFDSDLILREGGNAARYRPGPPLALLAGTHTDRQRFAGCYRT
jgi:hypothetical protein